jgi:hypothetical protein
MDWLVTQSVVMALRFVNPDQAGIHALERQP